MQRSKKTVDCWMVAWKKKENGILGSESNGGGSGNSSDQGRGSGNGSGSSGSSGNKGSGRLLFSSFRSIALIRGRGGGLVYSVVQKGWMALA
ncbi:hypothetical protein EYC84_002077 [Monilinia fructicola]|uniref:Uncharacterized protein n=1 Tax=Monilinia fructicola TaxID=38448 RepID=A0A5M9JZQ1_MONFR|nr:hypothetical protein EYC84_002077 [Monilinia fructicola]